MKKLFPVYVRVPLIFFSVFLAMEYFIDSGDRPAFIKYPMVSVFLFVFLFLIIAIEIVKSAADNITYQLMTDEQKKKHDEAATVKIKITDSEWYKKLMKLLTKSEPIENEALLLLDHDYDGIRELDNKLPPWWLYTFYAGILFGAIYLVRYEIMGGDDQETELRNEIAEAEKDVAKYKLTAPDMMDENKVTKLTDAAGLGKGKTIFEQNCAACHRADGGGQIGPNLTDDHWIFGGSIKNVFHTVTNGGRDGKGMVAWKGTLKPTEIQQVSSYILSLQGSNPKDPKAPDGDVWVDPELSKEKPAK
jgi:cytochrome c oxidase cbb3-type subunit III